MSKTTVAPTGDLLRDLNRPVGLLTILFWQHFGQLGEITGGISCSEYRLCSSQLLW